MGLAGSSCAVAWLTPRNRQTATSSVVEIREVIVALPWFISLDCRRARLREHRESPGAGSPGAYAARLARHINRLGRAVLCASCRRREKICQAKWPFASCLALQVGAVCLKRTSR